MELIDTHTHLYLPEFNGDDGSEGGFEAVERAISAGVSHLIFPNVSLSTIEPMTALANRFPDNVSMAMGLHPTEVGDDWRENLAHIDETIGDGSDYVAIGEVGIDLYWDKKYCDEQMQVLEYQAQRAVGLGLPLIIHCRDGLSQTLEVLQGVKQVKAVFHSFGGNETDIDAVRRVGDFYFGINGIVTFKNSDLRRHLPAIGLERMILETDSPYLAPVPHRGKRNESSYLPLIATHIAENMSKNIYEVAEKTTANAKQFFGLQ